jgi:hypothetical protein
LLHTPNGPNLAQTVSSPNTGAGYGIQAATFRVDVVGSDASHGLQLTGASATINARVLLMGDGDIEVLQVVAGVGTFFDIGDWTLGVPVQIAVEELNDANQTQRVYINGALAFTGQDISFGVNGVASPPHTAFAQAFIGTALTSRVQADNFSTSLIPEPTSLAALSLIGVLSLRRRRA